MVSSEHRPEDCSSKRMVKLHGTKAATDRPVVSILDVEIDNLSRKELLTKLTKGVIFTPNVDHIMKLRHDPDFIEAYRAADYRVCDSQILLYISRLFGVPLKDKISGSDLLPWFCDHHRQNPNVRIFMLGAMPGVAQEAQKRINERIGREIVVDTLSPSYGFEKNEAECEAILETIKASSANVLVVGVGAPKQEKWIAKYRDRLPNIDIFMAVGAAIDFEAGHKPRAPRFISNLGLEWLYRMLSEPRRLWKRYLLDDLPFIGLILWQWINPNRKGMPIR